MSDIKVDLADGTSFEWAKSMHIALRLTTTMAIAMASLSLPVFGAFVGTIAEAKPATCEDIFRKEKFLNASLRIGPDGRIETRLTNSTSPLGDFVNSIARLIYRPLSLDKIQEVSYRLNGDKRDIPFWEKLSDAFQLEIQIDPRALENIPRKGPLIIAANHPMNGIEGIALAALISKVRPDVKVVLTQLLAVVPGMADNAVFANPYGGKEARIENVANLEGMVEHLRAGWALIIFPTGTVSGKTKWSDNEAVDGRWRTGLAHLVRQVPATKVQPIYVDGQPSNTFLGVTLLTEKYLVKFPFLRTAIGAVFHVREIASRIGHTVDLTIGEPVDGATLLGDGRLQRAMNALRTTTYALRGTRQSVAKLKDVKVHEPSARVDVVERVLLPVAEAGDADAVRGELAAQAKMIYDMAPNDPLKRMKVLFATGREIPLTLNELGRLRELTFREVGEGSGLSRDLDEFDADYSHEIVIDKKTNEIAGEYRMGFVDKILDSKGAAGLYTTQYVDHSAIIATKLRNSLEIGRSFVVSKFQRRSPALMALFSGIGEILADNFHYRRLIGLCSISNEISERSQGLILHYLRTYHWAKDANLVVPKNPLTKKFEISGDDAAFIASHPTLKVLSERVNAIEKEAGSEIGMPPLIQIYVSLGAEFYAANVDPLFNTIDLFAVNDLARLPLDVLKVYMQRNASEFLEYHRLHPE